MYTTVTFRHSVSNARLERLIRNQIQCLDKFQLDITRVNVVVDVVNNTDKLCRISVRAAGELSLDIQRTGPGTVSAILAAFDALEQTLTRKRAENEKRRRDIEHVSSLTENDMLPFEEITSIYPEHPRLFDG